MPTTEFHDLNYFENLGDHFDEFMSPYDVVRRTVLIQSLLPTLQLEPHAIEIGCGTGAITRGLIEWLKDLTATDISEKLARNVGERLKIPWKAANACDLPFENDSFDLIISSECIEHTPDPWMALREMSRIIRPGGNIIVTSPNRLWYPVLLAAQLFKLRNFNGPENWLWPRQAVSTLSEAGLKISAISGCHLFPWQIPGAKAVLPFLDKFAVRAYPLYINYGIRATKPSEQAELQRFSRFS